MASVSVSGRRRTAYAAAAAAKQRRQKFLVIGGVALLALILAYEVPHTLKMLNGSSAHRRVASAPSTGAAPDVASQARADTALRALRHHAPVDPFSGRQVAVGIASYGNVGAPRGLRDPFASSGAAVTPTSSSTPTPTKTVTPVHILPKRIVIGQPGGGRVATHGWILILASIPTGQGRSSAATVAKKARNHGLTFVSLLNSSNRRPLRGGYWVVYTGPYPTLAAVNSASTHVHSSGFGDAYIRQLIVYKAK